MVHFATALASLVAILAAIVQAGNRGWEPKHDIQSRMSLLDQSSIAGNISQQEASKSSAGKRLRKRWNTVDPDSMKTALWPDSTITYCFESDDTREKLVDAFDEAKQKWADAGLPPSFGYKEVKGSACRGANRKNILMIKYNDKGRLYTTPALPEIDANDPKDEGPVMNLSDAEYIGMLNIAANYAHELGHAWGLLHEHQNPAFWSGLPMANTYTGEVWSPDTFNCQKLKDYEDAVESVRKSTKVAEKDKEFEIYKLYINRNSAGDWGFSAAEYLPYTNIKARVPDKDTMGLVVDDVDWASIMLYPSGAGAKGDVVDGVDERLSILEKPDGSKITPNVDPSPLDIQGLVSLYEAHWNPIQYVVLLNDRTNSMWSSFMDVFQGFTCLEGGDD